MAAKRGTQSTKPGTHKSVEYNLEKPPLQTGRTEPSIDLHTRGAMGDNTYTARRRMGGFLYLFLVAVILALGAVVVYLLSDVIKAIYYPGDLV